MPVSSMSRRDLLKWGLALPGMAAFPAFAAAPKVNALKITILSTMLAEDYETFGEWGFAALVQVDGTRFLFDSGAHPDTVLKNCRALKIDLTGIDQMILSHNHGDHSGGIVTLRSELMKADPKALSIAHVGKGIFIPRVNKQGKDENGALPIRAEYEKLGGKWVEHDKPTELMPGVWLTGPVPRPNDEHNWSGYRQLPDGTEDTVPEDSALIFDTDKGLVMLTGCGHAGVVNISQYARATVREAPFEAIIGGLHLFRADDKIMGWTIAALKPMGVRHLLGAHCTGIEATYKLREGLGLDRKTATVAAVGSWYDLDSGLHPGDLAG